MAAFLDLYGFIAVLLRAAILTFGSISIGGVIYSFFVNGRYPLSVAGRRLLAISALALAVIEAFYVVTNSAMLHATTGLRLDELAGANFFLCGCFACLAALCLAIFVVRNRESSWPLLLFAAIILGTEVATSHAAARLEGQLPLLLATALHQAATAAWIGGLPYLLLSFRDTSPTVTPLTSAQRFSRLSLWSVALLVLGGVGLSIAYIGSPAAIYGTNYGLMVSAKVILFLLVLSLGAINFKIVRQLQTSGSSSWLTRLSRIGEVEIGIGITAILTAASLTSQPPGVDLTADRVTLPTIMARLTPQPPRLSTPPLSSLTPSGRAAWKKAHPPTASGSNVYIPGQSAPTEPNPGDMAWSEYNHHWAGIVVLLAGVLAVLARFPQTRWARHWPLAFLGLALFLLLRADPEAWPLGPDGFWESFASADVAQHRIFVVLIVSFAFFEWGIQTGRLHSRTAALVFPGVCALGGALLLTHTHALSNIQQQLLIELSHLPLALLAVIAGWTRWLQLRYPNSPTASRDQAFAITWAPNIWPVCLGLIGVVLLLYREA